MLCRACGDFGGPLCPRCCASLRPAPDAVVGGVLIHSAFLHEGAPRLLVQRLKYGGSTGVVPILASAMAERVPSGADVLVPVPRSLGRRVRYGVDQAAALAAAVGDLVDLPVVHSIRALPLHRPNAGRGRRDRRPPAFLPKGSAPSGRVLLVDDVVTTGATLRAARSVLGDGVIGALAATRAPAHAVRWGGTADR